MKRIITATIFAFTVILSVGRSMAQVPAIRVNVPFNFTAQGQSYPAGVYDVSTDMNHTCVTLANHMDATKHITWEVGPTDAAKAPAVVTFDEIGADYALKTIQLGDKVTPNLDKKAKGAKGGVSATTSISGE